MKTLPSPGAEGGARPDGCVKGPAPERAWNEKGACMKKNGAAVGRKNCSPARVVKVGGEANADEVVPRAIVEGTGNARGM